MRTWHARWWWLLFAILLLLPLAIPGCDEESDDDVQLQAILNGIQEVPPVIATDADGFGEVTLPGSGEFIDATLQVSGVSGTVTAAHIHYGRPGEEGPILFTLFDAATDGAFPGEVSGRFTAADLEPQPPGSPVESFAEAVRAIREGNAYFNVRTTENPDGEIRGQIGARYFAADLTGARVVPPVFTTADGVASAVINRRNNVIGVGVATEDLADENVTAIRIHYGALGEDGPVLFTIFDIETSGTYTGSVNAVLTSANLATPPFGSPVATFRDAVEAMILGKTYISVETTTNPDGEVRGQFTRYTVRSK